jgi:hypothetical protein
MSSSKRVRWGGILAVVAGLAYIVLVLVSPAVLPQLAFFGPFPSLGTLLFPVTVFGRLAGIAGLHALQRDRYGGLGAVGALVAFVGVAIELIVVVGVRLLIDEGTSVGLWQFLPLALIGLAGYVSFVGLVLLGVATLRTRLLPRWFGVLLIFGLPVVWLLGTVGVAVQPLGTIWGSYATEIAYGVFWVLFGYVLLSSRSTQVQ